MSHPELNPSIHTVVSFTGENKSFPLDGSYQQGVLNNITVQFCCFHVVDTKRTLPIWFLRPGFFVTFPCETVCLCTHALSSCIVFMDLSGWVGSLLGQVPCGMWA